MDVLLEALAEQLADLGHTADIAVIGGAALQVLGYVDRPTRDVDVVALVDGSRLRPAESLPESLRAAAGRVARDFGLPNDWLNAGPADLLRLGLPDGFLDRAQVRTYGSSLVVRFAERFDLIHFKLYAMVDQGAGRHEADLRALHPTPEELLAAARWARSHDPSEGFRGQLVAVLRHLGVEDAGLGP
jgi:hypothetical protein